MAGESSPEPRYPDRAGAEVSLPQRTAALVRGLDLVLAHHGAEIGVRSHMDVQVHAYLDTSPDETVWLKRAKHMLSFPLAEYLRNELPPPPDSVFTPSGVLRRWWRSRMNAFNRKNTHLWYSWFQAKRSTLPVSDGFVQKTYADHYATLSKEDNGDDLVIDQIFQDPTFKRLLEKLRKEVTAKMAKNGDSFEERSASNSACFEQTRSKGGQHGELLIRAGLNDSLALGSELVSMRWDPVVYGREKRFNVVSEVRRPLGGDRWATLHQLAGSLDLSKPTKCTIQAVLEPMKVRVISKGEALPYYTCRPLQKAMHSSMRELDCFRLIGRPFSPTDMCDLYERSDNTDEWFSIDYSAATDGLSWKYSGRIFKFIIGDLSAEHQARALAVLGPHDLHYPDERGKVHFKGVQRNGQLMGSILSFPILCLANLGVYLKVNAERQKGWSDRDRLRHVLVNGDDMVYAAPPALWGEHIRVGNAVGLKMSVGKAYHHPVYANVNSTSVHMDLRQAVAPAPWQINYLNAGLFFGQHKVQGRQDDGGSSDDGGEQLACRVADEERVRELFAAAHMSADPARGLAINLNVVLAGSLPGRQRELLGSFLTTHAKELRRECSIIERRRGKTCLRTRNLFLPICVGGMGVEPPVDWRFKVSRFDRYLAQVSIQGSSLPSTGSRPLPGFEPVALETEITVPWVKKDSTKEQPSVRVEEKGLWMHPRRVRSGFVHWMPNSLARTT